MYGRALILDFGSQTTQLIARRIRELGIYCEIFPCTVEPEKIDAFAPEAIILSGGPASVHEEGTPVPHASLFDRELPMLGICYGMQLMVQKSGGRILPAEKREFGARKITRHTDSPLFKGVNEEFLVWMSHGDQVDGLPESFTVIADSKSCTAAAVEDVKKKRFGVQFHPEVHHTPDGTAMLRNFLVDIAGLSPTWEMKSFVDTKVQEIKDLVGDKDVVLGLSGGVDSSVAAALIHRAIGKQLHCVYVDHGLHRQGERQQVEDLFKDAFEMDLHVVDASDEFLADLAGVEDPEVKRKRIGHRFIEVFDAKATEIGDVGFLGQGTLYPDVIESISFHGGPSAVIKSHHNVGGLPERMKLKLLEPLRELFKDEVRILGRALDLPAYVVDRQPFPGPGLAVRILGEVTAERCDLLRKADAIVRDEIDAAVVKKQTPETLWQWFAVLLPIRSVGVMGDARTYEHTIAVRAVESKDAMTADWADLPRPLLQRISNRIINEVRGINRVVYDISQKPPATIEWE